MKKFLALTLALVLTLSLVTIGAGAADYTDNGELTYEEAVGVMSALDIVGGYSDGSFRPTNTLTRGAAAKIICQMLLGPTVAAGLPTGTAPFADVPAGSTYAGYIAYCKNEGIVAGYGDGNFRPYDDLSGFAFLKMLLGALGYEAEHEGYNKSGWQVAVSMDALSIGLTDGLVNEFDGSTITREEACLFAFNLLQKDLVAYENKSSIIVGDIIINTTSEAKPTGKTFAQVHFKDLNSKTTEDAFGRPAVQWFNGKKDLGTYGDKADAAYTAEVDSQTIYADLGLTATAEIGAYYIDGVKQTSGGFKTISEKDDTRIGGNGVVVEVFYDKEKNEVTVIQIDTLIGEISSVTAADGSTGRYVTVNGLKYETEAFGRDDIVLYTVDKSVSPNAIQTMAPVKVIENVKVTRLTGTTSFVAGGETYTYHSGAAAGLAKDELTVGNYVDLYLDAYGYVIDAKINSGTSAEAYVLDCGADADRYGDEVYWAKILKTDGSVEEIVTVENYKSSMVGEIVTYTKDRNGEYTFDKVTDQKAASVKINGGQSIFTAGDANFLGNNKTVYLVQSGTESKPVYTVYTGYANTVDLTAESGAEVAVYCKTGNIATVVFVKGAVATSSNTEVVYVLGSQGASEVYDEDLGKYYTLPAVVNGSLVTLKLDEDVTANTLFSTVVYDADGVMDVSASTVYTTDNTAKEYALVGQKVTGAYEDGIMALSGTHYAVADDVQVWKVTLKTETGKTDEAASVAASSIGEVEVSDKATTRAIVVNGEIVALFYEVDGVPGTVVESGKN
ncbi:MAG: S-layer homology domain-containing protein [Ruminococcaceae bacterium]|nr:S-layer homology domain-containing protein [Oscillospiraceae bacterium]